MHTRHATGESPTQTDRQTCADKDTCNTDSGVKNKTELEPSGGWGSGVGVEGEEEQRLSKAGSPLIGLLWLLPFPVRHNGRLVFFVPPSLFCHLLSAMLSFLTSGWARVQISPCLSASGFVVSIRTALFLDHLWSPPVTCTLYFSAFLSSYCSFPSFPLLLLDTAHPYLSIYLSIHSPIPLSPLQQSPTYSSITLTERRTHCHVNTATHNNSYA